MLRTTLAVLLCTALADILRAPVPFDLDVGVPPGSPTGWGRQFPVITPRRSRTTPRPLPHDGRRTATAPRSELELNIADSFGLVRILTWDLPNHLDWVVGPPPPVQPAGPTTGGARGEAPMPLPGSALYWTSVATLLRLLLHPQLVSELEVIAHLVEVGEPVLGVLDAAAAEKALAGACREIQKRLQPGRRAASPLPGRTPRETMLQRFVYEELVAVHPYDPEGGFGARLFLFADEFEPLLVGYCAHVDPFLRRNATAALGRCETARSGAELVRLGSDASDPVVQMRALAALGGNRPRADATALVDKLKASTDPVERVALVQALGRMRAHEAVPHLLAIGDMQRADPDTLMAVLEALARIQPPLATADAVARFGARVREAVRHNASRFRVRPDESAPVPDAPDGQGTRGEILDQLARLLLARLRPDDDKVLRAVLDLEADRRDSRPAGRVLAFAGVSLGAVYPPVQILFLETLGALGAKGEPWLTRIAEDNSVEPALRGQALARLPFEQRCDLAARLLRSPGEPVPVHIYALEVLAEVGDPRTAEAARERLLDCGRSPLQGSKPVQRYLWLSAVRALEAVGQLRSDDLIPLLARVEAPPAKGDPRRDMRILVERLVADVAEGLPKHRQQERVDSMLDFMIEKSLNPRITTATRRAARETIDQQLASLDGHRGDLAFRRQVVTAILQFLFGFAVVPPLRGEFAPVVMLEEELLLALGRTQSAEAAAALVGFLARAGDNPYRAHACLAIGLAGRPEFARHLVRSLLDSDGFVRFCAYEGLRRLTQQDYWADWLYGDLHQRGVAAEQYFRWCIRAR